VSRPRVSNRLIGRWFVRGLRRIRLASQAVQKLSERHIDDLVTASRIERDDLEPSGQ
jgi:hypothetical protein